MKPYLVKTPPFIQKLYPDRVWSMHNHSDSVYLTFDDGPIPEITPWVLHQLKVFNSKATFFCIGENIKKYPEIFNQIIHEGHRIGNHTFNHVNGWRTTASSYIENITKTERLSPEFNSYRPKLFRPPYGKLSSKQSKLLQKKGYSVIMWDILSADYDASTSEGKCLQNVLKNLTLGSIVVFHDSIKAEKNLKFVLPKVLEYLKSKGWKMKSL